MTTTLPLMTPGQASSWRGLMDICEELSTSWTLIGGQLVHLHCAERGHRPGRPTDDVDVVLDPRANPNVLLDFTATLSRLGFSPAGSNADGAQHRWRRGEALIDILIPNNVGERSARRPGITGSPTVQTPGGIQALRRTETVEIVVGRRRGCVLRPTLVGALIVKAAARTTAGVIGGGRHLSDFVTLSEMVAARDFRDEHLSKGERRYLRTMVAAVRSDHVVLAAHNDVSGSMRRLERAARLG